MKAFINFLDSEFEPTWKNPINKVKIDPNKQPPNQGLSLTGIQKMISVCYGKNKIRDIVSVLNRLILG